MSNPWETISLADYESHMKLETVRQLQAVNSIMSDQINRYPVSSVMILGTAGGNGLDHVDSGRIKRVYGVDINESFLEACAERYPQLKEILIPVLCDLQSEDIKLPQADIVIADLIIEYIGYVNFQKAVKKADPQFVSCVIQINSGNCFVSDSPYLHAFDRLQEVHREIDEEGVIQAMSEIGYAPVCRQSTSLPNKKSLLRLDFAYLPYF